MERQIKGLVRIKIEPHLVPPTKRVSYVMEKDVEAKMVTIADSQREDRGMDLIIQKSRAIIKGHLHEAAVTLRY